MASDSSPRAADIQAPSAPLPLRPAKMAGEQMPSNQGPIARSLCFAQALYRAGMTRSPLYLPGGKDGSSDLANREHLERAN
eukprot:2542946-Alexandrium_andersonii.AAC.1